MTFETPPVVQAYTISEAWSNLLRHPALFITQWNYKGAIMSGAMRAPIFLITYLLGKESVKLAIFAATVQFAFRFVFAGVGGALIQSFRKVEPPWKALLTILMIVPLISHVFEYIVQATFAYYTNTNNHTDQAIVRSVCVSLLSALFTLFVMRRNVMIVGEAESKSLLSDIGRLPRLVFEFCAFVPNEIGAMIRRRDYLSALLGFAGFGVFSQAICWAMTNKFTWTYKGGREIAWLKYWAVDGIIVMVVLVALSILYYSRKEKAR